MKIEITYIPTFNKIRHRWTRTLTNMYTNEVKTIEEYDIDENLDKYIQEQDCK